MNVSDKAHILEAVRRGECTQEFADELLREIEQREAEALQLPAWLLDPQRSLPGVP